MPYKKGCVYRRNSLGNFTLYRPKSRRTTMSLTPQTDDAITDWAEYQGISKADAIEMAIRDMLRREGIRIP